MKKFLHAHWKLYLHVQWYQVLTARECSNKNRILDIETHGLEFDEYPICTIGITVLFTGQMIQRIWITSL